MAIEQQLQQPLSAEIKVSTPTNITPEISEQIIESAREEKEKADIVIRNEYQKKLRRYNEQIKKQFEDDYFKRTGKESPTKNYTTREAVTKFNLFGAPAIENLFEWIWELDPEDRKTMNEFSDYWHNTHRDRIQKLSPSQRKMEIELGGVLGDVNEFDTATRSLANVLSLNIYPSEHPLYQHEQFNVFSGSAMTGNILGEIISYLSLAKVASIANLPNKIAAIGVRSPAARKIINILGKPKVWADKLPIVTKFLSSTQVPKYAGVFSAGSQAVSAIAIKEFQQLVRTTADTYRKHATMTPEQWENYKDTLPATYGMAVGKGLFHLSIGWP